MSVGRRLESLTLDNIDDIAEPCRSCVFWEFDQLTADRALTESDPSLEKEAWVSATLLEWGSCGTVAYVDDMPAGYALFAPPAFVPRATMFPTSPIGADALQLVTVRVVPSMRGQGLGRALIQSVARGLLRRGFRAIEAFGDATKAEPSCLVPAAFLVSVGFKTVRPHRRWPRLRMDLRTSAPLSAEVEVMIDRLIGAVTPEPALRPV